MSDPKDLARRFIKAIDNRDKLEYGTTDWHYYDGRADEIVGLACDYDCYDEFSRYVEEGG